ncbi:MAG: hypothetical protein KKB50_00640 [Planctomycetes bacterium]|nr:hypothetical protein [Planctomycetota bacterium]
MQPGSIQTFYHSRRVIVLLACVAPLVLLGSIWWLVDVLVLTPSIPDATTAPEKCVSFVAHQKGLPRLGDERREAFLEDQIRRLVEDAGYRDRFVAALRHSDLEEQAAFRAHLFDAFKPLVMRDVRRFHELPDTARRGFVDGRIVEYNRLSAFFGDVQISKEAFGGALPDPLELQRLLLRKTTAAERAAATEYLTAYAERVQTILADPALKAEFDARVAAATAP